MKRADIAAPGPTCVVAILTPFSFPDGALSFGNDSGASSPCGSAAEWPSSSGLRRPEFADDDRNNTEPLVEVPLPTRIDFGCRRPSFQPLTPSLLKSKEPMRGTNYDIDEDWSEDLSELLDGAERSPFPLPGQDSSGDDVCGLVDEGTPRVRCDKNIPCRLLGKSEEDADREDEIEESEEVEEQDSDSRDGEDEEDDYGTEGDEDNRCRMETQICSFAGSGEELELNSSVSEDERDTPAAPNQIDLRPVDAATVAEAVDLMAVARNLDGERFDQIPERPRPKRKFASVSSWATTIGASAVFAAGVAAFMANQNLTPRTLLDLAVNVATDIMES